MTPWLLGCRTGTITMSVTEKEKPRKGAKFLGLGIMRSTEQEFNFGHNDECDVLW